MYINVRLAALKIRSFRFRYVMASAVIDNNEQRKDNATKDSLSILKSNWDSVTPIGDSSNPRFIKITKSIASTFAYEKIRIVHLRFD
jgi:hypothetical protein